MKRLLLILFLISLLVAQQNEGVESTDLEHDEIRYNQQKLSVIKETKFNWRILKTVESWKVLGGNGQAIEAEKFFRMTESTEEQIKLNESIKLSRQQFVLGAMAYTGGATIAIAPQTGKSGAYIGLVFVIISQWLFYESYSNGVYPIIPFESAKIIAEEYNNNL